jgi:hypothetical protein
MYRKLSVGNWPIHKQVRLTMPVHKFGEINPMMQKAIFGL